MFTIYHSNDLDVLLNLIKYNILENPLNNPLQTEIIILPNLTFIPYLKIFFSKIIGIHANINYIKPETFIWNVFIKIIPKIKKENIFNKKIIIWQLMNIIPKLIILPEFKHFHKYLNNIKNINSLFELSIQIANLYDEYQKYRPEWLFLWENDQIISFIKNKDQIWQAKLWKQLIIYNKIILGKPLWYFSKLYNYYINNKNIIKNSILPERIFILNTQNIPLIYFQLLEQLTEYIEIHILINNPCMHYWDNIKLNKNYNFNNSLLFSWGNYGINNINKLIELQSRVIESFIMIKSKNLLKNIQKDVFLLREHSFPINKKKEINNIDDSIQINIFSDAKQEIEFLSINIIKLINSKNYYLHDIIVISPNLNSYLPFIYSIFNKKKIPFNIYLDINQCHIFDIPDAFLFLLNLSKIKCSPEEIFYLLNNNDISKKFFINDEDDLIYLRYWINDIGIKYGLDFSNFKNISLFKDQYTWKFGLYRMLYGYAIDNNSGNWNNIIPYNGTFGLSGELLGKFTYFLFILYKWKKKLNKKQTIKNWKINLKKLYSEFFYSNMYSNKYMIYFFKKIIMFIDNGLNSNYEQKISINIIIKEFQIQLEKKKKQFNYSLNKINFCNFEQLNGISFKASFVIGMNSKYYPKYYYPVIFNLIKKYPKKNDKNNLDKEKYFFLTLLMSSKEKLYLSYINNKNINYDKQYPSILITELLEYISHNYYIKKNKITNCIINKICHLHKVNSNFMIFKVNNYDFLNKKNININNISQLEIKKIFLKKFLNFWQNPLKGFFNQRLGIYLYDLNQIKFSEIEPFSLDYLTEYKINKKILYSLIFNTNTNLIYYQYLNKGILPYGNYGKILWNNKKKNICNLFTNYLKNYKYDNIIKYININISGIKLYGEINFISYIKGFIKYEPKIIDIKSIIVFWIEHLILCTINIRDGNKFISKIVGFKNTEYNFSYISPNTAIILLKKYLDGYIYGLNHMIMLPMKSSWEWLYYCFDKKNKCINYDIFVQKNAKKRFFYFWNLNSNFIGECNDLYFNRLNYFLNKNNWLKTIKLIEKWILPIMFYIK
ncbi:hypothetical protein GJT83_02230 [Enterobacteriaceae endosymbiont of Plateumaris pusilla]|uniref:exodeoxyribonuclease V subunit gamma n=1 Tax=Enterobacteriaceae endosymbiont of Plateumaris pusilla TaxID=2675795 RepID=UPI0014497D50|nr:exodeoxyribonuclease V subunit gamma [Enterobacteriaceae endosymbiont of Plateumaris pusilla]QJC29702.1 hypothetical protein GJT83_02230 [Enterobacteriaceae endosymbiont of Plateumaris pusilla]